MDYEVWSDFPEVLKLPILSVLRTAPTYHSLNFSQTRLDNLSLILEEAKIEKCSMFDWNNLTQGCINEQFENGTFDGDLQIWLKIF